MTALDLSALNPPQREAVEHRDGPLLVFAGAGSGKTRVLTYRLAKLIQTGAAEPWQLLAVTFTNKAAGEMKRRVADLLGGVAERAWIQTFHSACLRILRREAEHVGLHRNFVIYDERDQRDLIRRVLKEVDPSRRTPPAAVRTRIEEVKRRGVAAEPLRGVMRDAYEAYQRRLSAANAVDFNDLIRLAVELFEGRPEILQRYQSRFRYLLVDEFQDTDAQQFSLVRMLAAPDDNLCVVGDDDQSIYSFRGADVSNIRGFEDDYPAARVVSLEQNYRSTSAILDAASRVVNGGGGGRTPKLLFTERGAGIEPSVEVCLDENDEARRVVARVRRELGGGTRASSIAVLYRTNAQSRALEQAFDRARIPFVLVGGMRFFQRREIKEARAYLNLLVQPRDLVSFERAVRAPTRGIGDGTVSKVRALALERGLTADAAIEAAVEGGRVGPALAKRLNAFLELITGLRDAAASLAPSDLVALVVERSGLEVAYRAEGSHEGMSRADNLQELVTYAQEQTTTETGIAALADWLDRSALRSDADDLGEGAGTDLDGAAGGGRGERVNLMTIHCAKGLEFSVVCLVGLDQGIFPNSRAAAHQAGVEEEYRLCYVACTRAEDRLHLFRCHERMVVVEGDRGTFRRKQARPSPFMRFLVDRANAAPGAAQATDPVGLEQDLEPEDDYEVVYEPEGEQPFRVGMRVRHPSFGVGEIRRVDGWGPNLKLVVFFRRAGQRKLVARHARLQILR